VPREVYASVGPFDIHLRHSEDWDFCYRLARHYRIGFVPEALVQYRLHGTNMHWNVARMEEAMLRCLTKAFSDPDPWVQKLRRSAYGRIHLVLAGSYFATRRPRDFARNALLSLWYDPGSLGRLAGYPVRKMQQGLRRWAVTKGPAADR
jgi:GT2 family glycosyltransferase